MSDDDGLPPLPNAPWWAKVGISIVVYVTATVTSLWARKAKKKELGDVDEQLRQMDAKLGRMIDFQTHLAMTLNQILLELTKND